MLVLGLGFILVVPGMSGRAAPTPAIAAQHSGYVAATWTTAARARNAVEMREVAKASTLEERPAPPVIEPAPAIAAAIGTRVAPKPAQASSFTPPPGSGGDGLAAIYAVFGSSPGRQACCRHWRASMWPVPPRAPVSPPPVDIRLVRTHDEFAACEAMSRDIWGAAERNVVPRELLLTMQHNGGLVHGAFLAAGRLVGFCFAFLGQRDGQLRLCSHQLGVLDEFRGSGIGIALKQAQRYDALRLGIELVTWTFDPLEARNAYINLHRLGCIARLYDRDHYGAMEDELNRGLPSDRFEAEWWLRRTKPFLPAGDPVVMLRVGADGEPVRELLDVSPGTTVLISVPPDFQAVKRASLELAVRWRMESRAAFEAALAAGLIAVDFRRDGTYVMALAPADVSRPDR